MGRAGRWKPDRPRPRARFGAAETNGAFVVTGGLGADVLTGGAVNDSIDGGQGNDFITGGGGADQLTGGLGSDTFSYASAAQSTGSGPAGPGTGYDTITGFDMAADKFDLPFAVTVVDHKVGSGTLSTATFDTDLAAAITAAKLGASHAILFTPGAGTLSGHTFLVVDANGIAGYQAGADYVFDLDAAAHLSSLGRVISSSPSPLRSRHR